MIQTTYVDHMGNDLTTVNAARVSFGKKSEWEEPFEDCDKSLLKLSDRDTKLIKYLAKHKHLSPFGHAFASFHIKAPIFVARQLVKHKFLRWNEISRRYVDDEPEFYMPDVWRGKADNVKQGSAGEVKSNANVNYQNEALLKTYKQLLDEGVACEMARMVLPQSTMTEWYWSGSLDAFAAMCQLRCASDTQYESRVVADQISEKMSELFPVSWEALTKGETE
jgi:thymidylate synthase (FAD)